MALIEKKAFCEKYGISRNAIDVKKHFDKKNNTQPPRFVTKGRKTYVDEDVYFLQERLSAKCYELFLQVSEYFGDDYCNMAHYFSPLVNDNYNNVYATLRNATFGGNTLPSRAKITQKYINAFETFLKAPLYFAPREGRGNCNLPWIKGKKVTRQKRTCN